MNISELLKKDYWVRRVVPDKASVIPAAGNLISYKTKFRPSGNGVGYINLTQDDFLNEVTPAAHEINSKYMSQRPIYAPTGKKNDKGEEEWAISGYDEVESVALGLQEMIISKKIGHLTGDKFWVANETLLEEPYETFNSWADMAGLYDAYTEGVWACERTGDAAIYFYQSGDKSIDYEVFSYEKGDILYPSKDDKGRPRLCRQYTLNGKTAVDIFTVDAVETWVKVDLEKDAEKNWWNRVKNSINNYFADGVTSEDGFKRLSRKPSQVGSDMLQIVYMRVPDIATGPVQDSICAYERALSYISEEVKNSAFPILFVKSEKIINLPPSGLNGKTIGVKGTSDTVKNADAKFLAPPNSSDIAKIQLDALFNNILRGSMSALVEPDVLKQGSDSSTTIKILFAPDIIWCKNRWIYYAKPVRQLVEVFKRLVGKVEGDIQTYGDMRLSSGQNIYLPQNAAEALKMELDKLYARAKSRKAVMADTENTHKGDYAQVLKEWEEELAMKFKYSASGQSDDESNPEEPDINNQAAGKSIQE